MSLQPDIDPVGTVVTPVSIDTSRLEVRSEYFRSPIPLELLQAKFSESQILCSEPLVLKFTGSAHVVILGFGAVVYWQCNDAIASMIADEIDRLPGLAQNRSDVRDAVTVLVNQKEDRVNFRDIWLHILTLEHIRTISEVLGRSVALQQSERSVALALKNTSPIVAALESRGALVPSAKTIKQTVGFTLGIREAILVKLSLFDEPAESCESERLSRLHAQLFEHFDIRKRLAALQEKVTFLSDLNLLLMELLQSRTSHRLEWIVILLIVAEVLFSFFHFLTGKGS
jgi:uncharacterized Rmd1/YagE family protein